MTFELVDIIETANTLGECVLWDERQQAVWWTDIHESRLYRLVLANRALTQFNLPERLCSFGFTDDPNTLICAFASGFALFNPENGEREWLARPEADFPGHRFNDGRVDRQGRFWAGSMVEKADIANGEKGSIYCLSGNQYRKTFGGIGISNSICWSPESDKFYFADSTRYTINVCEFDPVSGIPGAPRVYVTTTPPFEPDGSVVDAEGYLWNALWAGGKVIRYDQKGQPSAELNLPDTQPTCVTFGGADMNLLFVTTARVGLDAEQLKREPQAGHLFIYRTPFTGLAETRFKI